MRKNKIKLYIIISLIFIIIISIFIINKKSDNNIVNKNLDNNIVNKNLELEKKLYNNIISNSNSKNDIKNCDNLKNKDFNNLCKNTIELKFHQFNYYTKEEECNNGIDDIMKNVSKEKRKDICLYNLFYREVKNKVDIEKCEKIKDTQLKELCKNTLKTRFN